jgi:S1-C subfamily serine protease
MSTGENQPDDEQVSAEPGDEANEQTGLDPAATTSWMIPPAASVPGAEGDPAYAAPRPARSVGRRTVSVVALVALGAAAGAGVSRAVDSTSRTANPPASAANGVGGSGGAPDGSSGGTYGLGPGGGGSGFGFGNQGGGGLGDGGYGYGGDGSASGSSSSNASDGPTDAATIARNADPGLVDITTTVAGGEAAGTGMVLTSSGEVLTNNHVIDGATSISVRDVGNGNTYRATVVGYDRSHDVAVLQLTGASGLTTVTTASSEPDVGAAVVGIGNAGGTGGTPSYAGGAITAVDRTITASDEYDGTSEQLTGLLGTDADIQAGDSGGPLVNTSGEVVGMDTAASSGTSFNGFDGSTPSGSGSQGFAIPISTALGVASQIESKQSSSTVHIGPTAELGVYVSGDDNQSAGAEVVQAQSSGPAANAGISSGDLITSVNGTTVRDANSLTALMTQLAPGQTVTVTYTTQAGANRTVHVTLGTGTPQ